MLKIKDNFTNSLLAVYSLPSFWNPQHPELICTTNSKDKPKEEKLKI